MLQRQQERLRKKLEEIDTGLRKRPQRPDKVERRIGRWLGRNTMVEKIFSLEVQTDTEGRACAWSANPSVCAPNCSKKWISNCLFALK